MATTPSKGPGTSRTAGPLPPHGAATRGMRFDRHHRQQKSETGLQRERRADVIARARARSPALRTAPSRRRPQTPRSRRARRTRSAARRTRAGVSAAHARARPHRPDRDARAAQPIGEPAGKHASRRAAADGDERGERAGGRRIRGSGRGEAGRRQHANPRPHRVELPHVPEVAERREPRAAAARGCAGSPADRSARWP